MNIGGYETQHFDIAPLAGESFQISASRTQEIDELACAAEFVDKALEVYARVLENQIADDEDIDEFETNISEAEEILDNIGEIEYHYYLRDVIEPQFMKWYEISDEEIDDVLKDDDFDDTIDDEDGNVFECLEF